MRIGLHVHHLKDLCIYSLIFLQSNMHTLPIFIFCYFDHLGCIKLVTCLSSEKFEKIGEGGEAFFFIFYFFKGNRPTV